MDNDIQFLPSEGFTRNTIMCLISINLAIILFIEKNNGMFNRDLNNCRSLVPITISI